MNRGARVAVAVVVAVLVVGVVVAVDAERTADPDATGIALGGAVADLETGSSTTSTVPSTTTTVPATTTTTEPPYDGWVDPASAGEPWGDTVQGILTFRGSPTRSFYGAGPVPTNPSVAWSFPGGSMCSLSSVGSETTQWCGTGWTGQPSVFERDGRTWVVFGAYDRNVHFVDGDTGERIIPDFPTGDIIKGSVTIDPDGYPIVYFGSRDNFLRAVSFDGPEPVELWSLDARSISPRLWNDDWDGSPMVIDDYLFEGGENSNFHIVKLNRGYDADGRVTMAPELVFVAPGWDDELLAAFGTNNVSIENSVMISGNTVWFANSGGLLQGWDITGLADGATPERIFRFWLGDDTDASLVGDDEGFIYAGVEYEKGNARSAEVGQIVKIDPSNPDDPVVWSIEDRGTLPAGVWATPAVYRDMVYASTDGGRFLGIDRATGEIRWEKRLPGPLWSSQVVVDDVLIQGDCTGILHAYDVSDTTIEPPELWTVDLGGGCIESTPAVWDGAVYVGSRGGQFHKIADL